jgi:hypothetical protein
MQHARHGRSSGSRHAYRSASALRSAARRPRVLMMLAVAAAGLTVAFWLPTRNDSAAANENGQRSASGQHRYGNDRDRRHDQNRPPSQPGFPSASDSAPPSAEPPTAPTSAPTSEPPTSVPPTSEPPATSAPPTTTPPTTVPPTTTPAVTKWAPFTNYEAGQIVTYDDIKYEVLAAHTSLPGWEPPALPALFKLIG